MNFIIKIFHRFLNKFLLLSIIILFVVARLYFFYKFLLPSGLYPPLPIDDGWYDFRYGFLWANNLLNTFPSAFIHPSREIYGWVIGNLLNFFSYLPYIPVYFQILLGILALLSLKRICTLVFNSFSANIAILIWGFYGLSILYDVQILKYSLTLSCMIITIDYYYQARFKRGVLNYIVFSLCAIFLLLFRLEFLPAVLWLTFSFFYKNIKFRPILMAGIVGILTLLFIFFLPPLYKTHLGIHTYMGNSINSSGRFMDIPGILPNTSGHVSCAYELEPLLREKFNHYGFLNNFWLQKTLDIIIHNPLHFILTTIRKFFTLISRTEDFSSLRIDYPLHFYSFFHAPWFNFQFVFILAFPSLLLNLKNSKATPLYVVLLFISLSLIFTIIGKPYRLQLIPFLACFAAHSIYLLIQKKFILRILFFSVLGYFFTCLPHSNSRIKPDILEKIFNMEQKPITCVQQNDAHFLSFLKNPESFDSKVIYKLAKDYFESGLMEDASLLFHYLIDKRNLNWEEKNYAVRSLIICYINLKRYIKADSLLNQYNSLYGTNLTDLKLQVQEMKKQIFSIEQYQ